MKKHPLFQGKDTYVIAIMWTDKKNKEFKYLSMMEVNANSKDIAVKKYITWATKKDNFGYGMYISYPKSDVKVIKK